MSIKVAIVNNDLEYFERLADALAKNHYKEIEIYFFPNKEVALKNLDEGREFDILLMSVNDDFYAQLPNTLKFAYLGESKEEETLNDRPVINKYQKIEDIYSQLVKLHEEEFVPRVVEEEKCKKVAFVSVAGGVGVSTVSSAYAMRMAKEKKVIYLNMEDFDSTNIFFNAEGNSNFKNVISALKDKESNLAESIENEVKCSGESVYFFDECKNVSDKMSMTLAEEKVLIDELCENHNFNYIVVDMKGSVDDDVLNLLEEFDKVVVVTDGSSIANSKTNKFLNVVANKEELKNKINILYNCFSNDTGSQLSGCSVPTLGGINRTDNVNANELAKAISNYQILDKVAEEN